jgi:hypothetical protein
VDLLPEIQSRICWHHKVTDPTHGR